MFLQNKKIGFSLIELLLVLGVIAAFAISSFMLYPKIKSSINSKTEISNINTIKSSINSLYVSSSNYQGLNVQTGISAKIFPDTMLNSNGASVLNVFKGVVVVSTTNDSPSRGDASAFTITYSNVPSAECVKIVSNVASNFYKVRVNTVIVKAEKNEITEEIKLNVSELSTACNRNNDGKATIIFISL